MSNPLYPVRAYIGLGSNLSLPVMQVRHAIAELAQLPASRLCAVSPLYCSTPLGPADQPDYINAVAAIDTRLQPLELLDALQAVEQRHGRVRAGLRWGPRTLDLDLLLYGDVTLDVPRLVIPHPGLHERHFVLLPLAAITPELILPDGRALQTLCATLSSAGLVRLDEATPC